MSDSQDRAIGRLEAQYAALAERFVALERKLDIVVERTDVARGGWKTLYAVGAIGAAIATGIGELLHWWHR